MTNPTTTAFERPFRIGMTVGARNRFAEMVVDAATVESDGAFDPGSIAAAVDAARVEHGGVPVILDYVGDRRPYRVEILAGADKAYQLFDVQATCEATAVLGAHLAHVFRTCPDVAGFAAALRTSLEAGTTLSVGPGGREADQETTDLFAVVEAHADALPEGMRRRIRDLRSHYAGEPLGGRDMRAETGAVVAEWTTDDPTLLDSGIELRTFVRPTDKGYARIVSGRSAPFLSEMKQLAKGVASGAFDYEETCARIGESSYMDAVDRCAEAMRLVSIGVAGPLSLFEFKALREDDVDRGMVAVHLPATSERDAALRGAFLMASTDLEADPDETPETFLDRVADSLEWDRVLKVAPLSLRVEAMREIVADVAALGDTLPDGIRMAFRGEGPDDAPAHAPSP